ncbi:hypothetical protein ACOSP7_003917 [Xanthoceras sorbifolium]
MANDSSRSSVQATHSSSSKMQSASSLDFASLVNTLNFNLPIKLDTILSAIQTLELEDLISSSITPSSKLLITKSISDIAIDPKVSEKFLAWNRSDNLLLCWLFSIVSKGVMGQVYRSMMYLD